jgi:hypothetical protein
VPRKSRYDRFNELLGEAKARGDADGALVALLGDGAFNTWARTLVVAALGDAKGPAGVAAVRCEFAAAADHYATASRHSRSDYRDLMCACVWALGKRDGPGSTDILAEAGSHASAAVRDYGLVALAAVGDDRAWDDMLAGLRARLAKRITSASRQGEALVVIAYLARHCGRDAGRRIRLAALLRERWTRLPEAKMVAGRYPGVSPDGLPPADIDFGAYVPRAPWARPPEQELHELQTRRWERESGYDAFTVTYGNRPAGPLPD